jgi:hypothetical protein
MEEVGPEIGLAHAAGHASTLDSCPIRDKVKSGSKTQYLENLTNVNQSKQVVSMSGNAQ